MSEKISTRVAYGEALAQMGSDPKIVVLDADLQCCTMTDKFGALYPERSFNVGIAEANMVGMAAGLASTGKTVFVNTFAMFAAGRAFDQIRNSLAYTNLNVKVIGTHAGITVGKDGATHQCIEDMAIMRAIPNMVVLSPCDATEAQEAARAMAAYQGPCYMRLGRLAVDQCVNAFPGYKFELGKAVQLLDGSDLTIMATGLMVQEAVKAQKTLAAEGISARVLDIHTIKPLDTELVLKAAKETGRIVTVEEHNVMGGLGEAVASYLSEVCPTPVTKIGVQDVFGYSGPAVDLLKEFGLSAENIEATVKNILGK